MSYPAIQVNSEIGALRRVLLHRPGRELENLMPEYIERLLFDDIPYLKTAREEHDSFCELLRQNGAEVVYLEDLAAEALADDGVRQELIRQFLSESGVRDERSRGRLTDYFSDLPDREMVCAMMAGVRKSDLKEVGGGARLGDHLSGLEDDYPFVIDPMPNLYFTRDPFACIGDGVTIHRMKTQTRSRETLFAKYIFTHNPKYRETPVLYDRASPAPIEGGDILVLSGQVIAIGISQRTKPWAIEQLAKRVLSHGGFQRVLAIDIPKSRSFMHLDTVFTQVDVNKFTMHPNISNDLRVFVLHLEDGRMVITEEHGSLEDILKEHLHLDQVELIKCGGGNVIDAAREQWNDGSNTFTIAPGKVVVYSRNYVTNQVLADHGVQVLTIPSSELSRGRGGPRCMTMPLVRDNI